MQMKHFLVAVLTAISLYASGSAEMGKTIYKTFMRDELGYIGDRFTEKYNAKKWQELFAGDAKAFKDRFGTTPKLRKFFNRDDIDKFLPHLEAFAVYYAKDSGYIPNCDELSEWELRQRDEK